MLSHKLQLPFRSRSRSKEHSIRLTLRKDSVDARLAFLTSLVQAQPGITTAELARIAGAAEVAVSQAGKCGGGLASGRIRVVTEALAAPFSAGVGVA